MQFRVPQFLDIEDKVFGPFTFKQFGYLLGAIGFAYIFWKLLPVYISMPLIIIISGGFLALGFVEINGRKFGDILEAAIKFFVTEKVFVWKKSEIIDTKTIASKSILENERLIDTEKSKINHKSYSEDDILKLSKKLDIIESSKGSKTIDLRDQILKNRNGFKI